MKSGWLQAPLLKKKELSALYDTLEVTQRVLEENGVPFIIVAGSLLGAVRSNSILFCDDDIVRQPVRIYVDSMFKASYFQDIAVFEEDYERVLKLLPSALRGHASYSVRPWPAADRIRSNAQTQAKS